MCPRRSSPAPVVVLAALLAWGCGCGARPVPLLDGDAVVPPGLDAGVTDALQGETPAGDGITPDGGSDGGGSPGGCIEGAVRLGQAVSCHPTLAAKDCRGMLCVDLLPVTTPPGAPLARACRANVDLGGGKQVAFSATFDAALAPPQTTILVGAFLAEEDPASPPAAPSPGDPTLSVPVVSYTSATHCPWINLELDTRW